MRLQQINLILYSDVNDRDCNHDCIQCNGNCIRLHFHFCNCYCRCSHEDNINHDCNLLRYHRNQTHVCRTFFSRASKVERKGCIMQAERAKETNWAQRQTQALGNSSEERPRDALRLLSIHLLVSLPIKSPSGCQGTFFRRPKFGVRLDNNYDPRIKE